MQAGNWAYSGARCTGAAMHMCLAAAAAVQPAVRRTPIKDYRASTTTTGTTPLTGGAGFGGSALNVNLPAAVGAGAGGAIGIGILAKNAILDLQISALETQGNAKDIVKPESSGS